MFLQRILRSQAKMAATTSTRTPSVFLSMFPTVNNIYPAVATTTSPHIRYFSSSNSSSNDDGVQTGTVKWFDSKKGFGFIAPQDGSEDVFVHQSAIHAEGFRSLADGEPVEYTVLTDDNGRLKAGSVTGPMGAYVQGRPVRAYQQPYQRRPFGDSYDSGYGSRSGGGGGGDGRNQNNGNNY